MEQKSVILKIVNQLKSQISNALNPTKQKHIKAVDLGAKLFNQRAVRILGKTAVSYFAEIQDEEVAHVRLFWEDFSESSCTCPENGICRHQLAVFFHFLNQLQPISSWISDWKNGNLIDLGAKRPSEKVKRDAGILNKDDGDQVRTVQTDTDKRAGDQLLNFYQSWVKFVDQSFIHELAGDSLYGYLADDFVVIRSLRYIHSKEPNNREIRPLFHLAVHLRILYLLLESANDRDHDLFERRYTQLAASIEREIDQAVLTFPRPVPFAFDRALEQIASDLQELLFLEGPFKETILSIYWRLWNTILKNKNLRKRELDFAKKTAKISKAGSVWQAAYCMQLFLAGDLDGALAVWDTVAEENFSVIILFIEEFKKQNQWDQITNLYPYFEKHFASFIRTLRYTDRYSFTRLITELFWEYANHTKQYDLYENLLLYLLPVSGKRLIDFYYQRREYRKLAEILDYTDYELNHLDKEMLRTMQKEDPECLLPIYHRAVRAAIDEKNRKSYKEAVRYLKRLRTIYRKLKQEEEWDGYLKRLLKSTRRLRAFQEECQKGKLVDAEIGTV